eukprot:TRINITY_DN22966_c0_g1_i1.p1 TRINITY_DN22966_c0_g1~~TRINITY_DN22966_c0_g1_i1.p1  ORF type:complete len:284 (+),score=22.32 TRINITY_DN22966_c0_g1_i1:94-945(+)
MKGTTAIPRRLLVSLQTNNGWGEGQAFAVTLFSNNPQLPGNLSVSIFKAVHPEEDTELRRLAGGSQLHQQGRKSVEGDDGGDKMPSSADDKNSNKNNVSSFSPGWPASSKDAVVQFLPLPEDDLMVQSGSELFRPKVDPMVFLNRSFPQLFSDALAEPLVFATPVVLQVRVGSSGGTSSASLDEEESPSSSGEAPESLMHSEIGVAVSIQHSTRQFFTLKARRLDDLTGRKQGWREQSWDNVHSVVIHWVALQPPRYAPNFLTILLTDEEVFASGMYEHYEGI